MQVVERFDHTKMIYDIQCSADMADLKVIMRGDSTLVQGLRAFNGQGVSMALGYNGSEEVKFSR